MTRDAALGGNNFGLKVPNQPASCGVLAVQLHGKQLTECWKVFLAVLAENVFIMF